MRLVLRLSTSWLTRYQQAWCAYRGEHGHLVISPNHLSVYCCDCGFESDGIDLQTVRVRYLWMHDRHRLRWHQRRSA